MALVRYAPNRGLSPLNSEVSRLFNTFFDTPTRAAAGPRRWVPAIDVVDADDHYVVKADLPGLSEDDVAIEVQDDVLTISGERTSEQTEERDGRLRVERVSGSFRRTLRLPEGVDPEQVAATFDRGVLEISIPKPEESKPRRVAIKVGERPAVTEGEQAA
jgi:HSP20 family protein